MSTDRFVFWIIAITGCVVCGWWLAVRPGASLRDLATPVAFLVIVMAVLLCLLAITGQDVGGYTTDIYRYTLGQ